jgi:hypothetical protein
MLRNNTSYESVSSLKMEGNHSPKIAVLEPPFWYTRKKEKVIIYYYYNLFFSSFEESTLVKTSKFLKFISSHIKFMVHVRGKRELFIGKIKTTRTDRK